jgi:hypothetical protein
MVQLSNLLKTINMKKLLTSLLSMAMLTSISYAQTIVNVGAQERQTFKHFGVNTTPWDSRSYNMPADIRATMLQMQYEGLKTNAVRIWGGYSTMSNSDLNFYKDFIIAKEKPMGLEYVHIVGGPGEHEPIGFNYYNHGKQVADFVKNCRDRGLQIDGVAWNNEPSMNQDYVGVAPEYAFRIPEMPKVAKGFKDQATALGLGNIKFVMGDHANSDNYFNSMIDASIADPTALAAIDAFACHSYRWSPLKSAGDKILAAGKEFHQNESADGDGNSRTDDAGENFRCIARYINDLNHGVSDWYWFVGIHGKNMNDLGNGVYDAGTENLKIAMINYAPNLGKIIAFPRYYYFKHVNSVLPVGTVMRNCTGANSVDIGFYDSKVINNQKVVATVGKRPDGRIIAVIGSEVDQTITINIAELAGTGSKTFSVIRSKLGSYEQNGGTITVTNGSVSIQAAQYELITLLESSGPAVAVTGVSITPTSANIDQGSTLALTPTLAPSNATNKAVTWKSSNTAIATVNANGVVTGVAPGTATITVTTADGSKTATTSVTVKCASSLNVINANGIIAASGENSANGEGKAQAFDGNTATKWYVGTASAWIQYQFANSAAKAVTKYTLSSANDEPTRDPKSWTLKGSNDGTTWATLDTKSNQTFAARLATNTYDLSSNTVAYKYYRFDFTNGGAPDFQLSEIKMSITNPCINPPVTTSLEAEDATRLNADIANKHAGYSGTGFVEVFKAVGAGVQFSYTAPGAGAYGLKVVYANGYINTAISLYVNGTKVKQFQMPTGASWTDYISVSESITLLKGANTITLKYDQGDNTLLNLDKIELTEPNIITGINTLDGASINMVYPNPFTSEIHISNSQNWILYNQLGVELKSGNSDLINAQDLNPGVYFIKLEDGFIQKTVK